MTTFKKTRILLIVIVLAILSFRLYAHFFSPDFINILVSRDDIASWLKTLGPLALVAYLALITLSVLSPFPDTIITVVGAYLFGPLVGGGLAFIGAVIGTCINFGLARRLGRSFVSRRFPRSIKAIDKYSTHLGWQTVVVLRIIPSVTFDIIGYAAGLSSMPFRTYLFATAAGMLPQAYITTFLGLSFSNPSNHISLFIIVAVAVVLVLFLSLFQKASD